MSYAKIISLEDFKKIRPALGNVVATSGGYDPIHPGHLSCIIDSRKYIDFRGGSLVVIVNGDWFLHNKKGKPFQDLDTRCKIVSCVREVDYVIPFEIEGDSSVCVALREIKPNIFTKGGDRSGPEAIPSEWPVCQELGIDVKFQVGLEKKWSSSDFLSDWETFILQKNGLSQK